MRDFLKIAVAASLLATGPALAQTDPICASLTDAYTEAAKHISLTWAGHFGDNSAPRSTNRWLEINAHMLARQMNLQMLIERKCPLPDLPVRVIEYPQHINECGPELAKGYVHSPACAVSGWTPKR